VEVGGEGEAVGGFAVKVGGGGEEEEEEEEEEGGEEEEEEEGEEEEGEEEEEVTCGAFVDELVGIGAMGKVEVAFPLGGGEGTRKVGGGSPTEGAHVGTALEEEEEEEEVVVSAREYD
jgi:hypothetical protein